MISLSAPIGQQTHFTLPGVLDMALGGGFCLKTSSIRITNRDLYITHIFLNRMVLSSVSRSNDRDLVFCTTYLLGIFAPFPLPAGFPPLISLEKYGGLRLGRARRGPPVASEKTS